MKPVLEFVVSHWVIILTTWAVVCAFAWSYQPLPPPPLAVAPPPRPPMNLRASSAQMAAHAWVLPPGTTLTIVRAADGFDDIVVVVESEP